MKSGEEQKGYESGSRAKYAFTGVIVALALVLFLTSDKGRAVLGGEAYTASRTDAAYSDAVEENRVNEAEFLNGLEERYSGGYEFIASDKDGKHYMLTEPGRGNIELVTYISEKGLDGICLRWVCPDEPKAVAEDATAIERDLYDKACAEYADEVKHLREALEASLNSITEKGGATRSEIEDMLLLAGDTVKTGKRTSSRTEGMDYTMGVYDENDIKLLVFSLSFTE